MVCSECGLTTVDRDMAACPRCDTQFARPVRALGWATAVLFALIAGVIATELAMRLRGASRAQLTPGYAAMAVTGVALATVFLVWFCRVRHNAAAWEPQSYGPGWAVGAWFLPGGNAWIPFRIAIEAWVTTFESKKEPLSIYAWWVCWIGTWVATIRLHEVTIQTPTRRYVQSTFSLHPFNTYQLAFAVAAAVFGALVVGQLSRGQHAWISGKIIQPVI